MNSRRLMRPSRSNICRRGTSHDMTYISLHPLPEDAVNQVTDPGGGSAGPPCRLPRIAGPDGARSRRYGATATAAISISSSGSASRDTSTMALAGPSLGKYFIRMSAMSRKARMSVT